MAPTIPVETALETHPLGDTNLALGRFPRGRSGGRPS